MLYTSPHQAYQAIIYVQKRGISLNGVSIKYNVLVALYFASISALSLSLPGLPIYISFNQIEVYTGKNKHWI